MKETLKQISTIRSLAYFVYKLIKAPSDRHTMQKLANINCPQGKRFFHILSQLNGPIPSNEQELITGIENERQRLLLCNELLVDGSFGEGVLHDKGKSVQTVCRDSKPPKSGLLMYLLIREFRPLNVIELGTNVGISSAYQAAALKLNDQNGKLTTLEVSPYRLRLAKELHRNLGLENVDYIEGRFSETLKSTLGDVGPIDFAFIDGHHQYQPTLNYFQMVWEHSTMNALFVFDDIRWSEGMKQAWLEIQTDERVGFALDLRSVGICVGAQEKLPQRYVLPPIYSALL